MIFFCTFQSNVLVTTWNAVSCDRLTSLTAKPASSEERWSTCGFSLQMLQKEATGAQILAPACLLAKEILLKTRSSCTASIPALGHSSRSVISSHFLLLHRGPQEKKPAEAQNSSTALILALLSTHLWQWFLCCSPPQLPQLPSRRASLHSNCRTLCHWTRAISHLLKKLQCEWLQLSDDLAWLAQEAG